MPYTPEHRAETRKRIVESARKLFNTRGFSDVSIDDVMAGAGLTRGGFYHHFKTKDELFVEAVLEALHEPPAMKWPDVELDPAAPPPVCAQQMIEAYLSDAHLREKDSQCPMVAWPSDIARSGPDVRGAFEQLLQTMRDTFLRGIAGENRYERALAIASLCVGGTVLARTVNDQTLATAIREAARDAALTIGGFNGSPATRSRKQKARAA